MTILSPEVLSNVLDLIESGASVVETTAAIGAAPKSKIIFQWVSASRDAGEFGASPDASSPFCIVRGESPPEWFHILFDQAKADGRVTRSIRTPPIRRDLEARLAAKRAGTVATVEPSPTELHRPPRLIVEHVTSAPVSIDPPAPKPRPSYAYKAPRIEGTHGEYGPPSEGRFSMTADRPKSKAERRAGTIEFSDAGIKQW
jgi:hypothetical protein